MARDGGIFSFGDATFFESGAGRTLAPVVGITSSWDGKGYAIAESNGHVDTFGDSAAGRHAISPPAAGRGNRAGGATGGRQLVGDDGRPRVHIRRRGLPRFEGWSAAEHPDRRHQLDVRQRRVLAGGGRRRHIRLRERTLPRLDGWSAAQRTRGRWGSGLSRVAKGRSRSSKEIKARQRMGWVDSSPTIEHRRSLR